MYKISVLWEHWCYRCYRCYRFTHIPKLEAPLTWAEQGDNDADVCSGTWVSTAELAAAKQQHQNQRSGDTSGSHTQAEGAPGWAVPVGSWPGRGTQAGGSPQHTEPVFATLYLEWDTASMDRQDPAPKLLSQMPVCHHHAEYGLNWPKVSPRMDYSQFSCSFPSCCSLSLKNTCALFVLEGLLVAAFADWKYPISN